MAVRHYRVVAPHFVAGMDVEGDRYDSAKVTDAAPILRWAIGKSLVDFWRYAKRKGWEVELNCMVVA